MNFKTKDGGWNPYLAGALTGLLMLASIFFAGKYFGASTTAVRTAGMIESLFASGHVQELEYYQKEKPAVDWQWVFVLGIFIGAGIAAFASKSFKAEGVPPIWRDRFGNKPKLRALMAFAGGLIAILGARLADGCPSGHGLSGVMQLAVSGLISMACFFIGGAVVANLLYRGGAKNE